MTKSTKLVATSFFGFEPLLWELAEYSDRHILVRTSFANRESKLGFPATDHCIPLGFHKRVAFEEGFDYPVPDNIGLLLVGPDTPQDVVRDYLPAVNDGGLVLFLSSIPGSREATPVLQWQDLIGARLCL